MRAVRIGDLVKIASVPRALETMLRIEGVGIVTKHGWAYNNVWVMWPSIVRPLLMDKQKLKVLSEGR